MSIKKPKQTRNSQKLNNQRPTFTGAARPKYVVPGYNVFDAALDRIRWLFDEFDNKVSVSNSGGKDSTVVVELALKVAAERGFPRGPLKVIWLDQECEFEATHTYQRWMADRPEIDFDWYQIPFKIFNATNFKNQWLHCWDPDPSVTWVRPKEHDSIHENTFTKNGVPGGEPITRFGEVLSEINLKDGGAHLTGMRAEESPARRLFMTSRPAYKWVTWGSEGWHRAGHEDYFMFHPIYDWRYFDVWKAILDNGWNYNKHYDHMHQYGVKIQNMRVSNYTHETALASLHWLQEIEPQTWQAATKRLEGISTYGHLNQDQYPTTLPYMFKSWPEYMAYLIDNLVDEDKRSTFHGFYRQLKQGCPWDSDDEIAQVVIKATIGNDFYGTGIGNYVVTSRSRNHAKESRGE